MNKRAVLEQCHLKSRLEFSFFFLNRIASFSDYKGEGDNGMPVDIARISMSELNF